MQAHELRRNGTNSLWDTLRANRVAVSPCAVPGSPALRLQPVHRHIEPIQRNHVTVHSQFGQQSPSQA